jgi:hypothetical protein
MQLRDGVPAFLEEEPFGVLAVERAGVHGFDGEE